jgi:RND family efflux transporter MFP subunit
MGIPPHSSPGAGRLARRVGLLLGCGGLAALFSVLVSGCAPAPASKSNKPPEVIVTLPVVGEVTDYQDFTGRLDALKTVDIRARVSGYVDLVPFKEGDHVHKGDLLFLIDPRTYQADYNQAEANLKQAIADRELQAKNVARVRHMLPGGSIGREEYDQTLAAFEKATATVGSNQAARDRARLYLDFCRVTSPLEGRISRRYVDPGNLVTADNTILTTIVTEDPDPSKDVVYAYFDVDERTYLDLLHRATAGKSTALGDLHLPVFIRLANEESFSHPGTVNFVDNRVNANTGTVRMRGEFINSNRTLKPGLFVRIRLPVDAPRRRLLVPDEALQSDQGRKYVYVINDKDEVVYKPVQVGQAIGDLRVITDAAVDAGGTKPGKDAGKGREAPKDGKDGAKGKEQPKAAGGLTDRDRVVISGMQKIKPGVKVTVKEQKPPAPPKSPLAQLSPDAVKLAGRG